MINFNKKKFVKVKNFPDLNNSEKFKIYFQKIYKNFSKMSLVAKTVKNLHNEGENRY